MNPLKDIFNIDFNADLYIISADSVVPNCLANSIRKRCNQNNQIVEKFKLSKEYTPNVIEVDVIKQKFEEYKKSKGTISFTAMELKKISYFADQVVADSDDYALLISLYDESWNNKYLHGFIYFLLNKWSEIEYNSQLKVFKDYILVRLSGYDGNKPRLLKIKENITYLNDGRATKFGKMLKINNISILLAPTIFGLKESAITYSYFSKVIQTYYHKDFENYNDLDEVLSRHSSTDTSKIVLSDKINYVNKEGLIPQIVEIKTLALKHIGDPATKSRWGAIGLDDDTKEKIKEAHENLNRWMIKMYIDVVFDTMIVDKERKEFWLKYIDHITSFKVVGSSLNKQKLLTNPLLQDSLDYYFQQTLGEYRKRTCSMVIVIKGYYFIEFSDLGALYVYKYSDESISKLLKTGIHKIEDLKKPWCGNLVEQNSGYYYHQGEGKMVHRGLWENRLTSWFKTKLEIYVD